MARLRARGLEEVIRKCVDREIPFLGICLGQQLLFESSEESPGVKGLHILDGRVMRIPAQEGLKVPHMGWNDLQFPRQGRLFEGLCLAVSFIRRKVLTRACRYCAILSG